MEARHPLETTVAKRHRGRWPMLKSLITEILVYLVLHCQGGHQPTNHNPEGTVGWLLT
jgi:hypothetical protein